MPLPLSVLVTSLSFLLWSTTRRSSSSSTLLTLLALGDLGLSAVHLHTLLTAPPYTLLARFPEEQQPWLLHHFALTLFFLLFPLFSLLSCLLLDLLAFVPRRPKEERVFLVSVEEDLEAPARPLSPLVCGLVPAIAAAMLATKASTMAASCGAEGAAITCLTGRLEGRLAGHGALAPHLLQLLAAPLSFPLTLLATIPLLLLLARTDHLVSRDTATRRLAWILFLTTYSLFLWDLLLYRLGPPAAPLAVEEVEEQVWRLVTEATARQEVAALVRSGVAALLYLW